MKKHTKYRSKNLMIHRESSGEPFAKISACGVCGTGLKNFKDEMLATYPLVPGHEIVSKAVDSEEFEFEKGMFVTVGLRKSCGKCEYCRERKVNL